MNDDDDNDDDNDDNDDDNDDGDGDDDDDDDDDMKIYRALFLIAQLALSKKPIATNYLL